jgi:hypothetical protein
MSTKLRVLITLSAAALLSLSLSSASMAQSQGDDPVADAARRAREQKKNATKPVRTFTNDNLPAAPPSDASAAPASGQSAPDQSTPDKAKPGDKDSAKTAKDDPQKKAAKEEALKQLKAELAQAQKELDVLQRKAALDSDSYYSKTNYAEDTAGKALLDQDTQQVNDKKAVVEGLKAHVATLQAEVGEKPGDDKPPL